MIENQKYTTTKEVLSALKDRQGGGLFFNSVVNSTLDTDTTDLRTAAKIPTDHKEFTISIYNSYSCTDIVSLTLFINPRDMTIGQQQIMGNTYTRRGWVNSAWGNQQATISASGVSAAFYFYYSGQGGLTNKYRRGSPSFVNVLDIVGLFKNNGWYFLDGVSNPSLFKDGSSRVINVMDSIKIEYDGSTYIGSFSTITLNDLATSPYKMDYSFEFIVASFGIIYPDAEGHVSMDDNYKDNQVHVALQGENTGFTQILGLDENELNTYFPVDEVSDPTLYDYSARETNDEKTFFSSSSETTVTPVEEGVFRITRGWRDGEPHGDPNNKCDFRTHTGTVYSATDGTVWKTQKSSLYGGANYIIVSTSYKGTPVYVRYYHLSTDSIKLVVGQDVKVGDVIGHEGTDNGMYPQHCDFGARIINSSLPNYLDCAEFQVNGILDDMWKTLHGRANSAPEGDSLKLDFTKLIAKHSAPGVVNEHEIVL
jgi:murein DD-endopeptidase MepM/ murein hydrolase activator NlpD